MKAKTNKNVTPSNKSCNDLEEDKHIDSVTDNLSMHSSSLSKRNKRKLCLSSQDEGVGLGKPKRKQKSKSKGEIKNEDSDSYVDEQVDFTEDFSNETLDKDNTPQSLKKKKKEKKKKNKDISIKVQPNTIILDYLTKWKNNRSEWKFEKVKQKRLIINMFDSEKLPEENFSIFLEYVKGGSKSLKDLVSKMANDVVDEMEKWEVLSDTEKETTPKVDENKYKRARTVLQMVE